jgi:hypothetical protein
MEPPSEAGTANSLPLGGVLDSEDNRIAYSDTACSLPAILSSVVQTGVRSFGRENRRAGHERGFALASSPPSKSRSQITEQSHTTTPVSDKPSSRGKPIWSLQRYTLEKSRCCMRHLERAADYLRWS